MLLLEYGDKGNPTETSGGLDTLPAVDDADTLSLDPGPHTLLRSPDVGSMV